MNPITVVFSDKQVSNPGDQPIVKQGYTPSPSANKPQQVAQALKSSNFNIQFVEPIPLTREDFLLAHYENYVDDILDLQVPNGFGTISQSVVNSLPYTNGAQYTAAILAKVNEPTCALVSGFHHAGYFGWKGLGHFCTFNGLIIAAAKLAQQSKNTFIIDCDMHHGNGTDSILLHKPELNQHIKHLTFGKYFYNPSHANTYLNWLDENGKVEKLLIENKPDLIIYQAGADVHVDDPYGGILTTEQIYERDIKMFKIAKKLEIPITWNLAGGYQIEKDGSIDKVLNIHMNTFKACLECFT